MLIYIGIAIILLAGWIYYQVKPTGPSPFAVKRLPKPSGINEDEKERAKVLKNPYKPKEIPQNIDAIVIGSGMGGLGTAALLTRSGYKVLVLEQHDQLGGCTHTFKEKGFEFDTGLHYIGEMKHNSLMRAAFDIITDGQLEWANMDENFDTIVFGTQTKGKDKIREYPLRGSRKERDSMKKSLYEAFPDDKAAIDEFFKKCRQCAKAGSWFAISKTLPQWIPKFLYATGLINLFSDFNKVINVSTQEVLDSLTTNEELKGVLGYSWGDYGTSPSESPFFMHAMLWNHFKYGSSYPIGGPAEIPYHVAKYISKKGGTLMVRADVEEILVHPDGQRVRGVRMKKDGLEILAPIVVSSAGVPVTFKSLLPPAVQKLHGLEKQGGKLPLSVSCISLFVGLKGDSDELNLPATNIWSFPTPQHEDEYRSFMKKTTFNPDESIRYPMGFISFPSKKDPTYKERIPGKSVCVVISTTPYEWWAEWSEARIKKRGDEYKNIKNIVMEGIWQMVLESFPHLEDKVEYMDMGTPLSNKFYLNAPNGALYGLDHVQDRFKQTWLHPKTPIEGLYLTGQDVFTAGICGALGAALITAGAILNRNLLVEIELWKLRVVREGSQICPQWKKEVSSSSSSSSSSSK